MTASSETGGFPSGSWLVNTIKDNPEGLLLLAGGCALLLRSGRARRADQRQAGVASWEQRGGTGSGNVRRDGISGAVDRAHDYASNVAQTVADKTTDLTSATGEYVQSARDTITRESEHVVNRAKDTIERVIREQPLTVAIAGLAAGAAVAATFPPSSAERATLGEAARRLTDVAGAAGERLTEAASAAGKQLRTAVEEKGLGKDSLTEVARDVAGTFGKSLTDSEQPANTRGTSSIDSGTGASTTGSERRSQGSTSSNHKTSSTGSASPADQKNRGT
jgi:ElaB/YqjD/DUF883 family membrane-anchored ribosome-binding protein